MSYDLYLKVLRILKVVMCILKSFSSLILLFFFLLLDCKNLYMWWVGCHLYCADLLVLEGPGCCRISATCATFW